jgi:glucose-6-phosphate 1-dehydrogenase
MAQTEIAPAMTGQPVGKVADPCVMVIFGASGDLTRRKLIPALYNLAKAQLLPHEFAVIGIARSPMSAEDYRKKVTEDMKKFATGDVDPDLWEWFARRIFYLSGNFDDKATYGRIKEQLEKIDKELSTQGNYFYYLATTPDAFGPIVESLSETGLMQQDGTHWRRVIIEKPFGHDVESARALNKQLLKVADEKQIYRIDHYLGKETVQNILALRFANGIFEPIWNRRYIDHIQISVAETVGVEKRGGYYDTAGALRDMVPNHIMQLITLTAMEPPVSFRADARRYE